MVGIIGLLAFSIASPAAGIRRGYVHGETDPEGVSKEPGKAVSVADVHATLLHALGIDTFKELMTPVGRPMAQLMASWSRNC